MRWHLGNLSLLLGLVQFRVGAVQGAECLIPAEFLGDHSGCWTGARASLGYYGYKFHKEHTVNQCIFFSRLLKESFKFSNLYDIA